MDKADLIALYYLLSNPDVSEKSGEYLKSLSDYISNFQVVSENIREVLRLKSDV